MSVCVGVSLLAWRVPWLSWLAVILLAITTCIFYVVPLRYIILVWGLVKFTTKLRRPDAVHHVGVLDFLARLPSNRQLVRSCLWRAATMSIVSTHAHPLLPSPSLSQRRRYCDAVCVRRICLGGEGNALYPVLSSFLLSLPSRLALLIHQSDLPSRHTAGTTFCIFCSLSVLFCSSLAYVTHNHNVVYSKTKRFLSSSTF